MITCNVKLLDIKVRSKGNEKKTSTDAQWSYESSNTISEDYILYKLRKHLIPICKFKSSKYHVLWIITYKLTDKESYVKDAF